MYGDHIKKVQGFGFRGLGFRALGFGFRVP